MRWNGCIIDIDSVLLLFGLKENILLRVKMVVLKELICYYNYVLGWMFYVIIPCVYVVIY
jgi:hypothetical protein